MITTAGIDPGFATLGMVAIARNPDGSLYLLGTEMVETDRGTKKELSGMRVSADDQRRLQKLWRSVTEFLAAWKPGLVGIEVYTPYKRQGGSAWKSSMGFALACCATMARNAVVQPYMPLDIRRALNLEKDASKKLVEDVMCEKLDRLDDVLRETPKTKHEHLADAAAYAYLAMQEAVRVATITGTLE